MTNPTDPEIRHMKWWGWGHEDVSFSDADKPKLWPYLKRELGLEDDLRTPPVSFEEVTLPESVVPLKPKFLAEIKTNNYLMNAVMMLTARERAWSFGKN